MLLKLWGPFSGKVLKASRSVQPQVRVERGPRAARDGGSICGDTVPVSIQSHRKSHRHLPLELASTADYKTRRQPASMLRPMASAPVGHNPPSSIYFCRNTQEGMNRKEQREVHRAQEHLQGRTWTSQARPGCGGSWRSWRGCPGVQVCPRAARARAASKWSGSSLFTCGDPGASGELEHTGQEEPQREHLQLVSRQPREPAGPRSPASTSCCCAHVRGNSSSARF